MKGVISRNRISIRYEKIQNIFVDQDFLDRIFKLYDVHIATADVQSATVAHIDGVSKENADRLKSILDEKIKIRQKGNGI
jgi:membrane protein YdbS with pleckstrin-like domain